MTDLVLVRPGLRSKSERHWAGPPVLGLGYLAAVARAAGYSVRVIDGKLSGHCSTAETVAAVQQCRPKVVGLTALTIEYPQAIAIAQALRQGTDAPCIVLGGAHANALPDQCLAESAAFDFVVAGEGETALPELLAALCTDCEPALAPGIYRRNADGTVSGTGRTAQVDAARLPFPAWHLFPRATTYPIMASRGCPYACVFCSHNLSRRVRYRPVESVLAEVKWLIDEFQPAEICFEDETFGLRRSETEQLLEGLVPLNREPRVEFKAQTRVDCPSADLFHLMRAAGFRYLELGIESGDADVLQRSGKGTSLEQVDLAVRLAEEAGLKVWANFILGLPGETKATIRHSIDLAVRLNPARLSVSTIVAYPGSQIHTWALSGDQGYRIITRDWSQFDKYVGAGLELENLPARTLRRLQAQFYCETYLRNHRLGELARLLWRQRGLVGAFAGSFLRRNRAAC